MAFNGPFQFRQFYDSMKTSDDVLDKTGQYLIFPPAPNNFTVAIPREVT